MRAALYVFGGAEHAGVVVFFVSGPVGEKKLISGKPRGLDRNGVQFWIRHGRYSLGVTFRNVPSPPPETTAETSKNFDHP